MAPISTKGIAPQQKLFHNERITVYPTTLTLDEINFWPENNRTLFTLERLSRERKTPLEQIPVDDITEFIANQDIHKLQALAESIERNGVQVPLIIRDDGKLLDGNRRYFACRWLRIQYRESKKPEPKSLQEIPAFIIKADSLDEVRELKILAAENFIPDLKVPWSLDARARAVYDYYHQVRRQKHGADREALLEEVVAVFGIPRQMVVDLLDALRLTKEFNRGGADSEERTSRRAIAEDKFVYFWEFHNKATKGKSKLASDELDDVKDIFFQLMAKGKDGPLRNIKQLEPMIRARHDNIAWGILRSSRGEKLGSVVVLMNEERDLKRAEDKIRVFVAWLKNIPSKELTAKAKSRLADLATLARNKLR